MILLLINFIFLKYQQFFVNLLNFNILNFIQGTIIYLLQTQEKIFSVLSIYLRVYENKFQTRKTFYTLLNRRLLFIYLNLYKNKTQSKNIFLNRP